MKKNVLVFGSISGFIVAAWTIASVAICYNNPNLKANMWMGYGAMIVAFSFIFVGIKNLRDQYDDGYITFGKAFKSGLYIALIASTIYVVTWLITYYCFIPDFMDKYTVRVIEDAKSAGANAAEIIKQKQQMATYTQMYKNPLMVIVLTYLEILPVGLIITIIAALILKRKPTQEQLIPSN